MVSFGSTVTTIVSRITVVMLFPLNVRALLAAEAFTVCRLVHRMQHHRHPHCGRFARAGGGCGWTGRIPIWSYDRQTNSARAGRGRSMAISEKSKLMLSTVS